MPQFPVATAGPLTKVVTLSPFPGRLHFTLALNNRLVAPPAYKGKFGYFPIEDNRVVAYDLDSGTQRWLVEAAPLSAPAVSDELLFISQRDRISALHAADGTVAWETPFADSLAVPLFFTDGWLLAATAGEVHAFRATDGMRVWQQPIAGARAALAAAGNQLYVSLNDRRVVDDIPCHAPTVTYLL